MGIYKLFKKMEHYHIERGGCSVLRMGVYKLFKKIFDYPCKVNDQIFYLTYNRLLTLKVYDLKETKDGKFVYAVNEQGNEYFRFKTIGKGSRHFGKCVFRSEYVAHSEYLRLRDRYCSFGAWCWRFPYHVPAFSSIEEMNKYEG